MTPDQRVEIARDYLQGARQRDVKYLPPTRLMIEVAETRHHLAQVLAVLAERQDDARQLAERVKALEAQTPQARQLQYEADLAAADLTESGYGEPW